MNPGLNLIEKDIINKICNSLDSVGILYRIFSRTKDSKSIAEKIVRKIQENKPYSENGKKMQDIIGIRIVTYFQDDIYLVKEILSHNFNYIDEEIDTPDLTVFKPKRTNIICQFDEENTKKLTESIAVSNDENLKFCDSTFELQLRTILSEGWHEIDHSLRYKCKEDWTNHSEKERLLNGVYANLEVNDLAMKALFIELSYNHFKERNWEAMLRNKFRLKFQLIPLSDEIKSILDNDNDLAKKILKLDREDVLSKIYKIGLSLPINFNNLIYMINAIFIRNAEINNLTPELIQNYTQQRISEMAV